MHWIGRGGNEIELFVKPSRFLVFRVDGEGAYARDVGGLERALHGVFQQSFPNALAVPAAMHGETCEQHDGDRVTRQPFGEAPGRVFTGHLADRQRVIADDSIADEADVGLRGPGLLVLPCVAQEIPVQFLPAAVKSFNAVIGPEFFNAAFRAQRFGPASKNPGSFRSRSRTGRGRGGASSAARKAFHCAALRPKVRRSASASSARASALSKTNSLTERWEAAAAACSARLASRVRRRSSFSLRVVVRVVVAPFRFRH